MSVWKIAVGVALGGVLLLVLFIAALGTLDMYSQVKACGGWDAWRSAFEIRPENPVPVCIAEKERVAREAREERKQEEKEQAKRAGEVILNQLLNEDRNNKQTQDRSKTQSVEPARLPAKYIVKSSAPDFLKPGQIVTVFAVTPKWARLTSSEPHQWVELTHIKPAK